MPKGRPRFASAGSGRPFAYTPTKTRDYEKALAKRAGEVMSGRSLLTGPLEMTVWAYLPVPRSWSKAKRQRALSGEIWPVVKPDWDNIGKITDALNCVVWLDDNQIVSATVLKLYSDNPRLQIRVEQL